MRIGSDQATGCQDWRPKWRLTEELERFQMDALKDPLVDYLRALLVQP
uniref:TATA-box-binding protein isoform X2 n=1 Tax=Rhizophora mucronata TaxID=61149 RepID=A0A2P2L6K5_RHIMU